MKKNINKMIITLVVIMISFFAGVNSTKALDTCDFGNNYGTLETRTQKTVTAAVGSTVDGTQAYNMDDIMISQDGATWDNEDSPAGYKDFYWVYAANHGYIKDAKFTVYSDDGSSTKWGKKKYNGKEQCEYKTDVTKLCKETEGQEKCETFKYMFKLNKKQIYMIKFEGTYYDANNELQKFETKKFLVKKSALGNGEDHVTTKPATTIIKKNGTTNTVTVTTTVKNKHIDSGSELKSGAASGTRKGESRKEAIKTNESGEIINSGSTSCTDVSGLIHDYWKYIMVIVPILLIVMMTLDFFRALSKGDSDSIKKAGNNAVKRTIAAVILLALPALLGLIFDLVGLDLCV